MTEANKTPSVKVASVSDQAASQDSLGFQPYVIAIAQFLTNPDTQPPLTLSVEGAWGSGKSSFMQQLQQEIELQTQEQIRSKLRDEQKKCTQNIERCIKNIQQPGGDLRKAVEGLLEREVHYLFFKAFIVHLKREKRYCKIQRDRTFVKDKASDLWFIILAYSIFGKGFFNRNSYQKLLRILILVGNIFWTPVLVLLILIYFLARVNASKIWLRLCIGVRNIGTENLQHKLVV